MRSLLLVLIARPLFGQEGPLPPALQNRQFVPSPFQAAPVKPLPDALRLKLERRVLQRMEPRCVPPMASAKLGTTGVMPVIKPRASVDPDMVRSIQLCGDELF